MLLPLPLLWAFTLALALVFGSFLNVCIARLPRHRSIAWPGSHCPHCHAPILARDNVPVLSWIRLRGHCRACRAPIAIRYLLVELAYPLLVVSAVARFGFTPSALGAAVFCFFAGGLLVTDLETFLLPDALTLPGTVCALGFAFANAGAGLGWVPFTRGVLMAHLAVLMTAALAALSWALVFLAIRLGYYLARRRHGMGLGDVKLAAMLAAWLGVGVMAVAVLLAVIAAACTGLLLPLVRRKPRQDSWKTMRLPFGAFLCAGGLYALFFGQQTLTWYMSFYR